MTLKFFILEYDNETFVKDFPEKLYVEYQAEGVEKAAIFSYTSMVRMTLEMCIMNFYYNFDLF